MGTEAGWIEQRVGFADAAAPRERGQIAASSPFVPERSALIDQPIDVVRAQPLGLAPSFVQMQTDMLRVLRQIRQPYVRGDVLGTRVDEWLVPAHIRAICTQPPFSRFVHHVVDEDHNATPQHARALLQPRCDPTCDRNPSPNRDARVECQLTGNENFCELVALKCDPHLFPAITVPLRDPEREIVEQLVGDDDTNEPLGREIFERRDDRPGARHGRRIVLCLPMKERAECFVGRLQRQPRRLGRAQRRGALDEHVAQRVATFRRGAQHVARQHSRPCARFYNQEGIRRAECVPLLVDCVRHAGAEQGADFGAGDEVPTGRAAGCEKAAVRVVERELHERVERNRALAPDARPDRVGDAHPVKVSSPTLANHWG